MILIYLVYESFLTQWSYRLDSKPIFLKDPFNFGQENSAAGAVKSMLMRLESLKDRRFRLLVDIVHAYGGPYVLDDIRATIAVIVGELLCKTLKIMPALPKRSAEKARCDTEATRISR